jgi:hypothetical protein
VTPLSPFGGSVTWVLPSDLTGIVQVNVPSSIASALDPSQHLEVVYNPSPQLTAEQYGASLGGGHIQSMAWPIELRVIVRDVSGGIFPFPPSVADQPIQVTLTVQANPSGGTFVWLRELQLYGQFAGYERDLSSFDPSTNTLRLNIPARDLNGTLFLPVILQPWWVQPIDPDTHIWGGPTVDDPDLGPVGTTGSIFPVVGTQMLGRIFVYDPDLDLYGWIEASGVLPAFPDNS